MANKRRNFTRGAGLRQRTWLDGDLMRAGTIVSDTRETWTPILGSELITNGDFTAWTDGTPDGWYVSGESAGIREVSEVGAGESYGGSGHGSANIYSGDGSSIKLQQNALTTGTWFRCVFDISAVYGTLRVVYGGDVIPLITTIGRQLFTGRAGGSFYFDRQTSACNVTLDNVSLRHLDLASAIRWRRIYDVSSLQAMFWLTGCTQAGLVVGKDLNNLLMWYLRGDGNAVLGRRAGGNWSINLVTEPAPYAAGAVLRLVPSAAFDAFSGYYNSAALFEALSLTTFAGDVSEGRFTVPYYAGVFQTHGGNLATDAAGMFTVSTV